MLYENELASAAKLDFDPQRDWECLLAKRQALTRVISFLSNCLTRLITWMCDKSALLKKQRRYKIVPGQSAC